jgi:signal transduction histidine kinase
MQMVLINFRGVLMKAQKSFLAILLVLLCITMYSCNLFNNPFPKAKNGVLDLRAQKSFSVQIPLDGQWNFYWNQLIDPHDSIKRNGVLVDFPFKWNGFVLNGKELPDFGYATYELTVLVPKATPTLHIAMPDVYCAYNLFINGDLIATNGTVSTTAKGFVPHWQFHSVDVPKNAETIKITLQVANFVHSKSGVGKQLFIAYKDVIDAKRLSAECVDLLLTGCLLMGGLFFFGLYLLGNRDKAIFLFSLYSIVYSYRIMGTDNYVLHTIFPDVSWYITVRLEYISLFLGIGLFGFYTRYLYPKDVSKIIVNSIGIVCACFAIATLVLEPVFFTRLINPFLIIMFYSLVYIPYVFIRAYSKKRPGSIYALLSIFSLTIVFIITLLHYLGVVPQLHSITFVCYISFFFLQSLVLSHRVSFVLKKAMEEAQMGLKVKGEFLSTMSHEIRTPLNSVIGMSHLLLRNNPREDQVEQLDVMLFSANNLLAIVNDILDYNKIEADKITFENIEMDIAAIVRNIVKSLSISAEDKGIELRLVIDEELKTNVLGDPTRLLQIMTNLVHNAIKFTQNGYVEVGLKVTEQTEKTIMLTIQVKDTGIGISKEKQKIIFERFTQADSSTSRGFGGTGLGLTICKRILEIQGSLLHVISEVGYGSTFYFSQTFEKSKNAPQLPSIESFPGEDSNPFTGVHILLVEDNPLNVMVAKQFLQTWGATLDVAVNGLEAIKMLDVTKHHLVLMDLHMPEMDGYEASRRIRASGITIPIIALTANLPKEIENEIKLAGMNDIVVKPFLPDELYKKIRYYSTKH